MILDTGDQLALMVLNHNDVSVFYDIIEKGLWATLPSPDKFTINAVMGSLLAGIGKVWVVFKGEEAKPVAFAITTLERDILSGRKYMLLYCLYAFVENQLGPKNWTQAFNVLKQAAKNEGCVSLQAFTTNEKVVKLTQYLGGSFTTTFVEFFLDKEN